METFPMILGYSQTAIVAILGENCDDHHEPLMEISRFKEAMENDHQAFGD
jgi:hypothetical protein